MAVIDLAADAQRAFAALKGDGIAIFPNDLGYAVMGGSTAAVRRINQAKGRGGHKRNAFMCGMDTQREVHVLDARSREIVEAIMVDYDLPLGLAAPFRPDHPLLAQVDDELMRLSTAGGTLGMLLNAGPLFNELCRLCSDAVLPVFGSSANVSGTGPKFRVEDIQPEIKAVADVMIDYGLRRFHVYGRSATILRLPELEVIRMGSCYELIADVLRRHFSVELPADPGLAANPSGHLQEFALPVLEVQP